MQTDKHTTIEALNQKAREAIARGERKEAAAYIREAIALCGSIWE